MRCRSSRRTRDQLNAEGSQPRYEPKPQGSDNQRGDGQRKAHAEVVAKADWHTIGRSAFDHDDVRDRSRDREVAGEGRRHGERKPAVMRIGEGGDERPQEHHGGDVADDVRQRSRDCHEDRQAMEIPGRDWPQQVGCEPRTLRTTDDDEQA